MSTETGTIAGVASALAMALIGAVSSYISYQQKKFCFSIQRKYTSKQGKGARQVLILSPTCSIAAGILADTSCTFLEAKSGQAGGYPGLEEHMGPEMNPYHLRSLLRGCGAFRGPGS